jgi:non-specific serine/threonine protein kinase
VGRSSIYILEGLTKLRQICDSPAILKEQEPYPNTSAKLDELIREIEENAGHHKALVFSQFTSMLELIRVALADRGIPYLYLDGSVSAEDRRLSVQQFQEEEDTRVFLISLKAGGVGLTLTAADYVYLVDPWWNPAAEQQAIDRSHRIGQVKKVFAYRMICKDSVEEKILQLQEKKRQLTADLVGDEGGFVKKLTQEDVAYLFS